MSGSPAVRLIAAGCWFVFACRKLPSIPRVLFRRPATAEQAVNAGGHSGVWDQESGARDQESLDSRPLLADTFHQTPET
jgi:hypothetical protein